GVDAAAGALLFHRSAASRARSRSESLGHAERMKALADIAAIYDEEKGAPFFADPASIAPRSARVRPIPGGEVCDWTWPSEFSLHCDAVAERYLAPEPNKSAAARLFLHADRPRPAALLLHGYRAGQYPIEERAWPVEWFYEKGLDVAIVVLPFHGVRAH